MNCNGGTCGCKVDKKNLIVYISRVMIQVEAQNSNR